MDNKDINYILPQGFTDTSSVYMIIPNGLFDHVWEKSSPAQVADIPAYKNVIEETKKEILSNKEYKMPISTISLDLENGHPELSFIDGRKRFVAQKEMGIQAIPALLITTASPAELLQIPFIKPLTPELKKQLESDEHEGNELARKLAALDELPEVIASKKKWAVTKEGTEALLKGFKERGFGAIAKQLLEHYQKHGKMPDNSIIAEMMNKVKKEMKTVINKKFEGTKSAAISEQCLEHYMKYGEMMSGEEMTKLLESKNKFIKRGNSHIERHGRGGGGLSM